MIINKQTNKIQQIYWFDAVARRFFNGSFKTSPKNLVHGGYCFENITTFHSVILYFQSLSVF